MLKNGITEIMQLGDLFDRRKFVNFQILDMWRKRVFDVMRTNNWKMHTLLGNHDVYFRNVNDVNSTTLLLGDYSDTINIISNATEHKFGVTDTLIIPWINSTNEKNVFDVVKKTKASIAFGHLELAGFDMDKGQKNEDGMDTKKFKKFHTVYSGHYHHKSDNGHIYYLCIPYQITWIDHGSQKGFHVWDSDTLDLTFVPNDDNIFVKFYYNDSADEENHWKSFDCSNLLNKYVKIIVSTRKNLYGFDQLLSKIYSQDPSEVKIVENSVDYETTTDEELNLEDTQELLTQYIDALDIDLDKEKMKQMMKNLYVEALHSEVA